MRLRRNFREVDDSIPFAGLVQLLWGTTGLSGDDRECIPPRVYRCAFVPITWDAHLQFTACCGVRQSGPSHWCCVHSNTKQNMHGHERTLHPPNQCSNERCEPWLTIILYSCNVSTCAGRCGFGIRHLFQFKYNHSYHADLFYASFVEQTPLDLDVIHGR